MRAALYKLLNDACYIDKLYIVGTIRPSIPHEWEGHVSLMGNDGKYRPICISENKGFEYRIEAKFIGYAVIK